MGNTGKGPLVVPTSVNDADIQTATPNLSPVVRRRAPERVRVKSAQYGTRSFLPHKDGDASFRTRLAEALGTVSPDFLNASLHQLIQTVSRVDCPEAGSQMELNAALALIQGFRPTNEVDAALALQAASTHRLAMDLMARVRRGGTLASTTAYGALAIKLLRAFVAQVEALESMRRGAQQTVRVEHVTITDGGSAIIGPVTHHGTSTTVG